MEFDSLLGENHRGIIGRAANIQMPPKRCRYPDLDGIAFRELILGREVECLCIWCLVVVLAAKKGDPRPLTWVGSDRLIVENVFSMVAVAPLAKSSGF